jgi:transcriptional regulator with XRE-family HTH domain
MTLENTAAQVGISAGFLSRVEREIAGASRPVLTKLSQVLNVPEEAIAVEEHDTAGPMLNGPAVRALRHAKDISAIDLAQLLGLDIAGLDALESNRTTVPISKARVVADLLGVPLLSVFIMPQAWR